MESRCTLTGREGRSMSWGHGLPRPGAGEREGWTTERRIRCEPGERKTQNHHLHNIIYTYVHVHASAKVKINVIYISQALFPGTHFSISIEDKTNNFIPTIILHVSLILILTSDLTSVSSNSCGRVCRGGMLPSRENCWFTSPSRPEPSYYTMDILASQ